MAAAAAGNCATAGQPSAAFAAITAVAAVAAEGLFYVGVAALWLLIVQWDLLDRLLGGPGAPIRRFRGSRYARDQSCGEVRPHN